MPGEFLHLFVTHRLASSTLPRSLSAPCCASYSYTCACVTKQIQSVLTEMLQTSGDALCLVHPQLRVMTLSSAGNCVWGEASASLCLRSSGWLVACWTCVATGHRSVEQGSLSKRQGGARGRKHILLPSQNITIL